MKKYVLLLVILIISSLSFVLLLDIRNEVKAPVNSLAQKDQEAESNELQKLSNGVQLSYFDGLMGKPTFVNQVYGDKYIENIYAGEMYYIQALSDNNDKVVSYAVTSRNEDFNPSLVVLGNEIVLNKTNFGSMPEYFQSPNYCYHYIGNTSPSYYFQGYYFGNPGNYQTYLFGINDSAPHDDFPTSKVWGTENCEDIDMETVRSIRPNTYVVVSGNIDDYPLDSALFGARSTQVRLLNE